MWPLSEGAACGAKDVAVFGELGLVTCTCCLSVVARAELLASTWRDAG